jgi:ubiquinol-cytochrome c reductase cytochrome c subunit
MVAALMLVGVFYAAFAPGVSNAADPPTLGASAARGQQIYETSCITCHGRGAQGVPGRGPSLIGVGPAAVEFQVGTGRMPATGQGAQEDAKTPTIKDPQSIQDLAAYIDALGGGPAIPSGNLDDGDVAAGGELFRINCSSCHGFGGGGGALSSGKYAPPVSGATDRQIYAAMLTGPQNMPVFGDNQLTEQDKKNIIAYLMNLRSDADPGGWGLGRLGPVSEGLAIFLIGMVALVFTTLWIAGKS